MLGEFRGDRARTSHAPGIPHDHRLPAGASDAAHRLPPGDASAELQFGAGLLVGPVQGQLGLDLVPAVLEIGARGGLGVEHLEEFARLVDIDGFRALRP